MVPSPKPAFTLLLLLGLASCQTARYTARLQPQHLQALDLEETLSRRDEVLLAYALSAYDAQNRLVATQNGAWGVEKVAAGQQFGPEYFAPIALAVPRHGRLVATLALVEVEDYQRAQTLVGKVKTYGGLASGAATLLQLAEVASPLGYLVASLQAAGLGLDLARILDTDDLLGSDTFEVGANALKPGPQRYVRPLVFKGRHGFETYHYTLRYEVTVGK